METTELDPKQEAAATEIAKDYINLENEWERVAFKEGEIELAINKGDITQEDGRKKLEELNKNNAEVINGYRDKSQELQKKLASTIGDESDWINPETTDFQQKIKAKEIEENTKEYQYLALKQLAEQIKDLENEHYDGKGFEEVRQLKQEAFQNNTIPEELSTKIEQLKQGLIEKGVDENKIDTVIEIRQRNLGHSLNMG